MSKTLSSSCTPQHRKKKANSSKIFKEKNSSPLSSAEILDDISIVSKTKDTFNFIHNFVTLGIMGSSRFLESEELKQVTQLLDSESKVKVKIFTEQQLKNESVDNWEKVHVLLCDSVDPHLLGKVKLYSEMHQVYLLNDVNNQAVFQSRPKIYALLKMYNLPVVKHVYSDSKSETITEESPPQIEEFDDWIQIGKQVLRKPFIEKPVDSRDHRHYIYFSTKTGGGCKLLFKKDGVFHSKYKKKLNDIRRNGHFIYEKYLPHDGFDIHVKTIGVEYFHAQATKSPTMRGSELQSLKQRPRVSFPVNLTMAEKSLCRKVVLLLGQLNCQIDIIRSNGKSFICDVNGFSLEKAKKKFLKDFVFILKKQIYARFFPFAPLENKPPEHQTSTSSLEFKNFLPQKSRVSLSTRVSSQLRSFKNWFTQTGSRLSRPGSSPKLFQSVEDSSHSPFQSSRVQRSRSQKTGPGESIFKKKLVKPEFHYHDISELGSLKANRPKKKEKMRSVIAMFLHQDRTPKQKLKMVTCDPRFLSLFDVKKKKKVLKLKSPSKLKKIIKIAKSIILESDQLIPDSSQIQKTKSLNQIIQVLEDGKRLNGINRKVQLKPLEFEANPDTKELKVVRALLVLKWGGNITHSGLKQAERFGSFFRENFYKNEQEGLLRLHSTYRHDLKIYSADEGRSQLTAAALTKGLLMIEDNLTPILSSFVNSDRNTSRMLDITNRKIKKSKGNRKKSEKVGPSKQRKKSDKSNNFLFSSSDVTYKEKLRNLHFFLKEFCGLIRQLEPNDFRKKRSGSSLCQSENLEFFIKRWTKLCGDFYCEQTETFDPSKLTNILDFIR